MGNPETMNTLAFKSRASVRHFLLALIVTALSWTLDGTLAEAQNIDLSTNNVDVDLSVIEDAGTAPPAGSGYMARSPIRAPGRGLLLPGASAPRSQLHVAVPEETRRIKLRPPGAKPTNNRFTVLYAM